MSTATFTDIKSTSWLVQTQTMWTLYSTVNRQSQLLYTARWSVDWQDSVVASISDKNVVVLGHSEAWWTLHLSNVWRLWLSIAVYDLSVYSNYTDHTWWRPLTDHIVTSGQLDSMPRASHTVTPPTAKSWLSVVRCVCENRVYTL